MASKKRKSKAKPRKSKGKRKSGARSGKSAPLSLSDFLRSHPRRAEIQRSASLRHLPGESYESRRNQVRKILSRNDVDPDVIDDIVGMDPVRSYAIQIYGRQSSPRAANAVGGVVVRQAVFVGPGLRLWSRAVAYSNRADIALVDIAEIATSEDHPLWDHPFSPQSVKTVEGVQIMGQGYWGDWNDRRKLGRPKKGGGRMTAEQRRANSRSKHAANKRRHELRERIDQLKSQGKHLEADRLLRRADAAKKKD